MSEQRMAHPFPVCICVKCGPPWRETRPMPTSEDGWVERISWHSWMALCPRCGSKRCPGALDHDEACEATQ